MIVDFKFNIGDAVVTCKTNNTTSYNGVVVYISIRKDNVITYTVLIDTGYNVYYDESELTARLDKDLIYYAKVHSRIYKDVAKDNELILPMSYISLERTLLDNVKITYDSMGIFKDIEKI